MNRTILSHGAQEWDEAQRRAETYLRALRVRIGPAERALLSDALAQARERNRIEDSAHPVPLVMEALFDLLPPETVAPFAMTPPMQRVTMIPEKTEFPLHDAMRRLFQPEAFFFSRRQLISRDE